MTTRVRSVDPAGIVPKRPELDLTQPPGRG